MTDANTAPLDEQFDTQMEVERNPCGAWQAIQTLSSALLEALDRAETKPRNIFASDGNEEARWIEEVKHACPHCGGSGHKDDVRATTAEAALESARKVIEPFGPLADAVDEWRHKDDDTCPHRLRAGDLRAARQWLTANQKEVKG